jgi:hypothetical protein
MKMIDFSKKENQHYLLRIAIISMFFMFLSYMGNAIGFSILASASSFITFILYMKYEEKTLITTLWFIITVMAVLKLIAFL